MYILRAIGNCVLFFISVAQPEPDSGYGLTAPIIENLTKLVNY